LDGHFVVTWTEALWSLGRYAEGRSAVAAQATWQLILDTNGSYRPSIGDVGGFREAI
jgi:hypothetical protein